MTTALATIQHAKLSAGANGDQILIQLLMRTKHSEKTRVQCAHSTSLFHGFVGKPLASITL